MIRSLLVAAALVVSGLLSSSAQADTLPVEFQWCSQNELYVCALVYGVQSGGIEMGVQSNSVVNARIVQLIGNRGRTLAMNIDGKILKIKSMSGSVSYKLQVNSLEVADDDQTPRPR